MTVWYAGRQAPCIPDSHLYRVTNTRCRIGTVFSPDDGHIVARNMYRKAINILRKFVHEVVSMYNKRSDFYIHGSVRRKSILIRSNKMQEYAGIYILQNHYKCFGCPSHPSLGVREIVTAASCTSHIRDTTCTRSCSYSFMYS